MYCLDNVIFPGSAPKMFKIALIAVASFTLLVEAACPQTAIDAIPSKETFDAFHFDYLKKAACETYKAGFEAWSVNISDDVDDCMEKFKIKTG